MRTLKITILSLVLLLGIIILTPFFGEKSDSDMKIIENTGKLNLRRYEDDKNITFNYLNDNNKLIYSWIFDKNNMDDVEKINLDMKFEAAISSLVNSTDSKVKVLSFDHHGLLPKNTMVKVYVKDKYEPSKKVNMYYYDEDIELLRYKNSYVVDDEGYVLINLDHCSDYVLTGAIVQDAANNPGNINIVIMVMIGVVILLVGAALFSSSKK